jgi:hypothetical protein
VQEPLSDRVLLSRKRPSATEDNERESELPYRNDPNTPHDDGKFSCRERLSREVV